MQRYKDMSEAQQLVVKWVVGILIIILGLIAWDKVFAGGYNHSSTIINNNYVDNRTVVKGVSDSDLAEAIAKSAACGANFYYGTNKQQGAVHGAYYDGESELCLEWAYRPKDSIIMWDAGVVPDEEGDKVLFRGGIQFEF